MTRVPDAAPPGAGPPDDTLMHDPPAAGGGPGDGQLDAVERSLVRTAAEFAAGASGPAADWDRTGGLPDSVRKDMAAAGLLGADLPRRYGGAGLDPAALGEVAAHLGGVCSALRGLLTVQGMVAAALARWGTREQRADWLPRLASGELTAGFAATEQAAGSALGAVETRIDDLGDGADIEVSGRKKWITFGAVADVFLVLGKSRGKPATVLVEADRTGVSREPVTGQLGMRAARIAHVTFDAVRVPRSRLVAPPGLGLSHVAATALDHGRFTVAWGCVGMAEACVADAAKHAATRSQGGVPLADHQLVRSLLARCAVDTAGARELARRAAEFRAPGPGRGVTETIVAKYAAAAAAASVSRHTVQILGSAGCEPDSRPGRHFRDAKVMEIIEGAQHVSELHIADRLLRQFGAPAVTGTRHPGESV
ncbi:acyl-CoA/acyl-ACP dehydrogenase [Streptomyces scopuliridis]|uniref:Acyl-CoA/acyl-ACP dehydrogenase n=1 Tax=Streptomyces scopuliridis TaxID=452529 RepID=A0ACD4ZXW7_9ACTN|nr:acyl-CoA dehydrogenase family protein [Streptomyces scopuliridis]WSC02682.1 acyl-CoA/acyl-ACP dehydrogenase [Streptomyces scopuliridis]WSC03786.1 acyl-CoA/acyl-ACP dehydrogenase [Streptomyces scopuliridis]